MPGWDSTGDGSSRSRLPPRQLIPSYEPRPAGSGIGIAFLHIGCLSFALGRPILPGFDPRHSCPDQAHAHTTSPIVPPRGDRSPPCVNSRLRAHRIPRIRHWSGWGTRSRIRRERRERPRDSSPRHRGRRAPNDPAHPGNQSRCCRQRAFARNRRNSDTHRSVPSPSCPARP
jgi:hypothetical protein